ncbi:Mitotic spindle assembly checkpoint protein [Phytophthora megakarya]|uniref:Mitotic spindle assembly checkpoint protein n=1 Tax=Phytophthora megakarya TaxID=4795 RepID=A0A225X3J2_9STRA|nr:Mitotic spindle assembly checkpoint protein [Phytophthora megakarya]
MTTDTAVVPESTPAQSRADEGADFAQDSSQTADVNAPAAPTFAFASWKAELELMLQRESETLFESLHSLQSDFDERSQFVRGDFAWRKQVTAFHDRLQDVLTNQFSTLSTNISSHAAQVAESLALTLAKVEHDAQRTIHQQEQKGESALRRTRTALAKEVERITRLEKCLRSEEARQAAAILAERERQLITEHNARENHLKALLNDMRASNDSLETLNTQLLESLRTSRTELQQLKNTLMKSVSRPNRKETGFSRRSAGSESPHRAGADKSGKNNISRDLKGLPTTANDLLLVPALRQSLTAANEAVTTMKARVSELESAKESDKKKLREVQLTLAQAENEKAKATKLLGEARLALIDNESKLVEAANECASWQNKFDTLQVAAQGRERALADSQRLEHASRDQMVALTCRLQRVMTIEVRWQEFEHAVAKWKENLERHELGETSQLENQALEHIVESFLRLEARDESVPNVLLESMETQKEIEVRIRYEFEKRFGDQLNLRVSLERRRVLERLERLCATEAKGKQERSKRTRQSVSIHLESLESDFTRLKRLVKGAYDQLGICVGPWADTDLDGLHARLGAVKAQVQALENELEDAASRAESQRVSLVRAELAQQEKDLLLAELTSRFRQLRATQVAWDSQHQQHEQQGIQQRQLIKRKPLTVYGVSQPMVHKPKLHALTQLRTRPASVQQRQHIKRKPLTVYGVSQPMVHKPKLHALTQLRTRPASAAPCLQTVKNSSLYRLSQPSPSRLGSRLASNRSTNSLDLPRKQDDERVEKVEDHVRSVLKSALMQPEIENFEDTVGSDGVSSLFVIPVQSC